jgi:hypothetical protein
LSNLIASGISAAGALDLRLPWKHTGGNANRNRVGRNAGENHRIGSNAHIVSYMNRSQNLGPRAYINTVAEDRRAPVAGMLQSHSNPVANDAIVSKDYVTTDDDSAEMVDAETPPKSDLAGKFDACQYLRNDF